MDQPSDAVMDLAFMALDHGIESVSSGGTLTPFVVAEGPAGRKVTRFATETLEEGLARAQEHISALGADVTAYAIAHDGFLTVEGQRSDAILVEVGERGVPEAHSFAQRYKPKKGLFGKFETIGNAALAGPTANRLG